MREFKIIRATLRHKPMLVPMFDAYRTFYDQPSNIPLAEKFIQQRLTHQDSVILIATDLKESEGVGFVQLFPSFSSVSAEKIYILNDLYVKADFRNKGIARQLLKCAKQTASENGVSKLILETGKTNEVAQRLYESEGYIKDSSGFLNYFLQVPLSLRKNISETAMEAPLIKKEKDKKVVVITGVTSGLGRSMLDRFNELGWKVVGCARSASEIEKLDQQFRGAHYFEVVDVSDPLAVNRWCRNVASQCGAVDLLINNASIINKNGVAWEIPQEEFSRVMDINVMGAVNVIRSFFPAMDNNGTIINVSSWWGRFGEKMLSPYCASKFAIEGLSQSMALELPKGMTVVSLDPGGGIDTPMLQQCSPESVKTSPSPDQWSRVAVPFILSITPESNGKALTCPDPLTRVAVNQEDAKKKVEAFQNTNHSSFWWKSAAVVGLSALALGATLLKK